MPTYLRTPQDLEVTMVAIQTLRATAPALDLLVVDDCSPVDGLWDELASSAPAHGFTAVRQDENGGFSRAVNRGLQAALDTGRDALLVNADIQFIDDAWFPAMTETTAPNGDQAGIVGARLIYPNGLIQHAGVYFSLLTRVWDHWYRYAPAKLPEAHRPRVCPVTGALQLIRHGTLEKIGLYDEDFRMGWEDVDYCLRAFEAGISCVYQPKTVAIHHESLFRGNANTQLTEWQSQSWAALQRKHAKTPVQQFIPPIV